MRLLEMQKKEECMINMVKTDLKWEEAKICLICFLVEEEEDLAKNKCQKFKLLKKPYKLL